MPSRERPRDPRAAVVATLAESPGRLRSAGEIQHRAGLHPGERTAVKRILRDLVREGLARKQGKRFAAAAAPAGAPAAVPVARTRPPALSGRGAVGTLARLAAGYGFVDRLDGGEDVFVPAGLAAEAISGDLVRVEVVPGRGGRPMARSLEVVERRRRTVLGTYHPRGRSTFAVPLDRDLEGQVTVAETRVAAEGDLVKVALEPGPGRLRGRVVERVGRPGDPRLEALRVAYARGFSDLFPDDVAAEAEAVPDRVRPEDRAGRRDLTGLRLVTIDGEDARDFDDAVHVERLPGRRAGWRLVVAIADVSHYVRPGSALDSEALRRGTSVYFPQLVLPMLPERLSNGICSLNPEVERLCLVADMRFDGRGEVGAAEVYPAVMRSAARCTYGEVAQVLSGERVPHREFLRPAFQAMGELQEALTAMRRRRGAIDFDLPEPRVVLGDAGQVLAIEKRPRNRAHRLVEEFMLAANEAVARWFGARDLPTIYRVHGLPDEEKLEAFLDLARAHGFPAPETPGPRELNALLERMGGHPQQRALNQLLLRAMMQAVYSPENIGHFGLAAEHYLHFTSPIRRYPDLVVHRLLRQAERRGGGREGRPGRVPDLAEVAALASERERAAMQCEREVHAYYAALLMQDKVGQRFPGVVATVAEFGLFVELRPWFVEGLVKVDDLGPGFELDPALHALVERRSGRAFRVGDELEVEVLAASPARRQIDLGLVEGGEVRRAPRAPPEGRGRGGRRGAGERHERGGGGGKRASGGRRSGRGGGGRRR
ncbi:MAG TPA: ribonuclease R [Anaeromyxobacteraceae bacterium]|nr:ribonuclease R [Anaeromyxobacteraceae bacterium]